MQHEIDAENPTEEQLQAYGALAFLYLRTDHHRDVPMRLARRMVQPPIDLGFYKVFYIDDVPRYAVTWAFLSEEAESKVMRGELLLPSEWRSGDRMWVIEIIAPYGQGTAAHVVKWLRHSLPDTIKKVRYLRADSQHKMTRVIEVTRVQGPRWGARKLETSK